MAKSPLPFSYNLWQVSSLLDGLNFWPPTSPIKVLTEAVIVTSWHVQGSMEPVRHSMVTYIENLQSQHKGTAECPEMSALVKELLVSPLHTELRFCSRKDAHTLQNWCQFLWWIIIIIHLCLPSLKILAWWPAGTYTEQECRARPHSAIPFQDQECLTSSGRADLCRQLQKMKLNLWWIFPLSDRHTGILVQLFFSHGVICVTLLFQLSASHVSEAVPHMHGLYISMGFGLLSLR